MTAANDNRDYEERMARFRLAAGAAQTTNDLIGIWVRARDTVNIYPAQYTEEIVATKRSAAAQIVERLKTEPDAMRHCLRHGTLSELNSDAAALTLTD